MAIGKITPTQSYSAGINRNGSGIADHNRLKNRDLADQHPISAITGLESKLATQDSQYSELVATLNKAVADLQEQLDKESEKAKLNIQAEAEERKANDDKLAADIQNNKVYVDDQITKLDQKITSEIDPKLSELDSKIVDLDTNIKAETDSRKQLAAHNLSIYKETDGTVKVTLLNAAGEPIATQSLIMPSERILADVKLDYESKKLIFTFEDTSTLDCDLSSLIDDLQAKLSELSLKLDQVSTTIESEIERAEKAENDLQTSIDAESAARLTADDILKQNLEAEATARQEADTELQQAVDSEAATRQAVDEELWQAIKDGLGALQIEDVSTVSAVRNAAEAELEPALVYDSDVDYYEYTYPTNKSDCYGSWRWKVFDPDMLLLGPEYRLKELPYYFISTIGQTPRFKYILNNIEHKSSRISAHYSIIPEYYDNWHPKPILVYGSPFPGLQAEGWRDGTYFEFRFGRGEWFPTGGPGWSWYPDGSETISRDIVFYDHVGMEGTDGYRLLPYLSKFADKLSDDTLELPLPKDYIKTWVHTEIFEEDFLLNPKKYYVKNTHKIISFIEASTYDESVVYYKQFNGVSDPQALRGTWYIDEQTNPLDIDYEVKGWYFCISDGNMLNWSTCPVFNGFILKKSEDGTQLLAQAYDYCDYDDSKEQRYIDKAATAQYVLYDAEQGWLSENYRYISVNRQYGLMSTTGDTADTVVYDYSLLKFLSTHATKISDKLIGADHYTVADFKAYLNDNYVANKCYKCVGQISESDFESGVYYTKVETEKEQIHYDNIVRFAIDTVENKDTVIRSAIGQDILRITDTNAVVNGYFSLAPETDIKQQSKAHIVLENNAEISLTDLADYVIFEIPETVQHGYCSSAVLVLPEAIDTLPYAILNKSNYELQLIQSGSIIDKLVLNGNCQYNLLFMCNGIKLELYIQEIPLS